MFRAEDTPISQKRRRMTEQSSTVEDLTVTTAVVAQQTATGSGMTSSTSRGAIFYFQIAVVVIGVIGTAANALILYALVASKQHRKHVLIVSQNALDLVSCVFLVVTYIAKLCRVHLSGSSGYWFCATILSEAFIWWGILGSKINLAAITIERYLKVVHPAWRMKWLRNWMLHLAMAFIWICPLAYSLALNFTTTDVIDGVCYGSVIWKSRVVKVAHGIWNFVSFYVVILLIIVFGYWRILICIRRQMKVMAEHQAAGPSTAQIHSNQIQSNVIKTMILVSAFFAVTNFPVDFYFLLVNVNENMTLLEGGYIVSMFIVFFYSCANPFIYAVKFDPVKRAILSLIRCKQNSTVTVEYT